MNNFPIESLPFDESSYSATNVDHSFEENASAACYVDNQLTPTPNRRRLRLQSVESHESDSSKAHSLGCSDSGHCSSDFQVDAGIQDILRQKDQALFLALQDVRRLRSELERLTKSERWYKQELRTQKHSRLEALEKLYTNERNYMQENQRLQRECMRLYSQCGEVERELEEQRENAMLELHKQQQRNAELQTEQTSEMDQEFENMQQRALIVDQQQLIDVLRKQKRALLADLKRLNEEKDAKIYELQKTLAELEEDNQRITKECKTLLDERNALVTALTEKANALEQTEMAHESLQAMTKENQAQAASQQHELEIKEREILELQRVFKQTLQHEQQADEIHRLSVEFHQELTQKTIEITTLKNSINALQQDLVETEDLHMKYEQQQRDIEQLRSLLEEKDFELSKMHDCDIKRLSQLEALKAEIDEYQSMTRTLEHNQQKKQENLEQLLSSQEALNRTQLELIALNEKYANMCALCERTRFELELCEIESRKLQFEKKKDTEEIKALRIKLAEYLQQTERLSKRINELEKELIQKQLEEDITKLTEDSSFDDGQEIEPSVKDKVNEHASTKVLYQEDKDENDDFKSLSLKFIEMNDYIEKLGAENGSLKDYMQNETTEPTINEECLEIIQTEGKCYTSSFRNESSQDDFYLLNDKLKETHALLQQLQDENEVLKTLVEEGTNVSLELLDSKNALEAFISENQKLKEVLKSTLEENHVQKSAEIQNLNVKLQEYTATSEKLAQENQLLKKEIIEITNSKEQNIEINTKITAALATYKTEIKALQLKLLKNDAKLYKLEKIKNQLEYELQNDEKYIAARQKNKQLQVELENLRANQLRLEHELKKKDLQISNIAELEEENLKLRQKLQESVESYNISIVNVKEISTNTCDNIEEDGQQMLLQKVATLEAQLQQTQNINEQQKLQRVELLNQLLEQQNQRVSQLYTTQSDWEELLKMLNDTQALEANTRTELENKRGELEELNELFSEQNDEMQKLQELMLIQQNERDDELNKMQQTFQQQIVMIQQQVKESEIKNTEQSKLIESLQLKNQRLTKDIDEDFAIEIAENKKELRILRNHVDKLNNERDEISNRMQEMENELTELRRHKREAMIVPQIVYPESDSDSQSVELTVENNISNNNKNNSSIITDDHLRILAKVLESEHQRKLTRYDLHIRALLHNVKSLKRSLAVEEQKVFMLQEQQEQTVKDLQEYQNTKRHLFETRERFEQAQKTIKTLEQQLILMHEQYESTDCGKSKRQESTHEVANLIDDYKKLIQQSAATTQRPKTSAIIDLIQRSNQCVPNLNKLETSVQELHHDIQHFIANQYTQNLSNNFAQLNRVPSLMDELKAATTQMS